MNIEHLQTQQHTKEKMTEIFLSVKPWFILQDNSHQSQACYSLQEYRYLTRWTSPEPFHIKKGHKRLDSKKWAARNRVEFIMWGMLLSQGTQLKHCWHIQCDNMTEQFTPGELGVNKQQTVFDLRHLGWNWFVTKVFLTSSLECLCISEVTTDSPS